MLITDSETSIKGLCHWMVLFNELKMSCVAQKAVF